jgi:hypothetical protein
MSRAKKRRTIKRPPWVTGTPTLPIETAALDPAREQRDRRPAK